MRPRSKKSSSLGRRSLAPNTLFPDEETREYPSYTSPQERETLFPEDKLLEYRSCSPPIERDSLFPEEQPFGYNSNSSPFENDTLFSEEVAPLYAPQQYSGGDHEYSSSHRIEREDSSYQDFEASASVYRKDRSYRDAGGIDSVQEEFDSLTFGGR